MKYQVTIPLWGANYVDRFLRFTLPTLRAAGNLPALKHGAREMDVIFYTDAADATRLAPAIHDAGFPHKFVILAPGPGEGVLGGHGGTVMKQLFQRGFDRAWEDGSVFVPVCGDVVYSDLFFDSAAAMMEEGRGAVLTQGAGINVEVIGPELDRLKLDDVTAMAPRDLFRLFFRLAGYGQHMPTWPDTRLYPAQIFFPIGEHATLMRCAHMYAAMVKPDRHAVMDYSHDNDLVEKVLTSPEQLGWLDDSDRGFFFGLAEPASASLAPAAPQGDQSLEHFCRRWLSPWKARYFGHSILWHDGTALHPEDAQAAMLLSDSVVDEILTTYRAVGGVAA